MSDETVTLTPVDWVLLENLGRAVDESRGSVDSLETALKELQYFSDDGDKRVFDIAGNYLPDYHAIPLALRIDSDSHARRAAEWLLQLTDADDLEDALVSITRAQADYSTELPYYLFHAYFSPVFRPVAIGLGTDDELDDPPYDGDDVLLQATGKRLFPDPPQVQFYDLRETRIIASGLSHFDLDLHPQGDMGELLDFFEDSYGEGLSLQELCEDDFQTLKEYYVEATTWGWGTLVSV